MLIGVRQGDVDLKLAGDIVRKAIEPYGISVTGTLADGIRTYLELLLSWNRKMSLTAVTDPEEILRFHFGESMFAAAAEKITIGRLADVGTGAGFPGIPIKMIAPGISLSLIEANGKKAVFLAEVVRELGLSGVEIVRGRVESMPGAGVNFDIVAARALGGYGDLLRLAKDRLLAQGGRVLFWLGGDEVRGVRTEQGWNFREPMTIPGTRQRYLLAGSPD